MWHKSWEGEKHQNWEWMCGSNRLKQAWGVQGVHETGKNESRVAGKVSPNHAAGLSAPREMGLGVWNRP